MPRLAHSRALGSSTQRNRRYRDPHQPRLRGSEYHGRLGRGSDAACSIAAFGLLTALIWDVDFIWDVSESLWRSCACASVLAIAGGHACLMLRGRQPTDSSLVELVTLSSLAFGSIDAGGALLLRRLQAAATPTNVP